MFQGISRKEIIVIVAALVLLLLLVLAGVYYRSWSQRRIPSPSEETMTLPSESAKELERNKYTPQIPNGAVETKPVTEAPAAPGVAAKLGTYDIQMSRDGFDPASVTVKKGNLATIYITAVDGNYDVRIPYMEMWITLKQGEKKPISFQTTREGTFLFECDKQCPAGGKVQGTLIVLP